MKRSVVVFAEFRDLFFASLTKCRYQMVRGSVQGFPKKLNLLQGDKPSLWGIGGGIPKLNYRFPFSGRCFAIET